jgi:hypothetical protein
MCINKCHSIILIIIASVCIICAISFYKLNIYRIFRYQSLPLEKINALDFIAKNNLDLGQDEMNKHKAVFVGISRDNTHQLPEVIRHIEYIGQHFMDYRVIVFENDSTDGTKFILQYWKNTNPKVSIISKDYCDEKRPSIKFISDARNEYLETLKSKEYDEFDIIIPVDMDMVYGIDIRGIKDSFSKIDKWDAICSNGIFKSAGNMYDVFAFRNEEFPESPTEHDAKHSKDDYWSKGNIKRMQKIYRPESDLMPVYSCFGGLAIYKRFLFKDCVYDSIDEDCEHVYLHQCMRNKYNARIFLNPAQIIRYEHWY